MMDSHIPCPLCGADNKGEEVLAASHLPWRLKRCKLCELVYLENSPAYDLLETDFAWEKTFALESDERRKRSPLRRSIGRALKASAQRLTKRNKLMALMSEHFQAGPILDIGCAGGHTFQALADGYIPYGIEISRELSERAGQLFAKRGGSVIQANALTGLAQLPPGKFKGVVMTSFLEHDGQAKETLSVARRVMSRDGRIIIKVPNYASWNRRIQGNRWCGFRFPDHVLYFTPRTLARMLLETGYEIVRFSFFDRLPTSDTMWLVARVREPHSA